MSQFPGQHLVSEFKAGVSKALDGNRLAKIGYKKTKKVPNPPKSICVSVPLVNTELLMEEDTFTKLVPHIKNMVMNAQDALIRNLYEGSKYSLTAVTDEDISMEKVIGYLEEQETGGRLTLELVKSWFDIELSEKLMEFAVTGLKARFPNAEECAVKANQVVNGYSGMFAALAGGKTYYPEAKRKNLLDALGLSEDGDEMAERLSNRLEQMAKMDREVADIGLIDFGV